MVSRVAVLMRSSPELSNRVISGTVRLTKAGHA
jgi:hypothetical protein